MTGTLSPREIITLQVRADLAEQALRVWDAKVRGQGPDSLDTISSPAPLWYWDWNAYERIIEQEVTRRCQESESTVG